MKKSIILSMIIVFLAACVSNDVEKTEADTVKEVEKDIAYVDLTGKTDTNAALSGKKLLAKILNGVKQPTVFCPFERLGICV